MGRLPYPRQSQAQAAVTRRSWRSASTKRNFPSIVLTWFRNSGNTSSSSSIPPWKKSARKLLVGVLTQLGQFADFLMSKCVTSDLRGRPVRAGDSDKPCRVESGLKFSMSKAASKAKNKRSFFAGETAGRAAKRRRFASGQPEHLLGEGEMVRIRDGSLCSYWLACRRHGLNGPVCVSHFWWMQGQ